MNNLVEASADGALRTERRRYPRAVCAGGDRARLPAQSSMQALDVSITFDISIAAEIVESRTRDHQLMKGMARR